LNHPTILLAWFADHHIALIFLVGSGAVLTLKIPISSQMTKTTPTRILSKPCYQYQTYQFQFFQLNLYGIPQQTFQLDQGCKTFRKLAHQETDPPQDIDLPQDIDPFKKPTSLKKLTRLKKLARLKILPSLTLRKLRG
jgi:hypothetical protein